MFKFTEGKHRGKNPQHNLTGAEMRVLSEMGMGGHMGDVAKHLGISKQTVKNHCSEIYKKLGVTHASAAIIAASKIGLIYIQGIDKDHFYRATIEMAVKFHKDEIKRLRGLL